MNQQNLAVGMDVPLLFHLSSCFTPITSRRKSLDGHLGFGEDKANAACCCRCARKECNVGISSLTPTAVI